MKRAILICVLLWTGYAVLSYSAVRQKSATADETGHAVVGWFALWRHDYRIYDANPPLWEYWIALGTPREAVRYDPSSEKYQQIAIGLIEPFWTGLDRDVLIRHGRMMCLIVAMVLAVVISIWAWQLCGPLAAVSATFLFALDPSFLGHGSLIKNDVACALCFVASAMAIWHCGMRLTRLRVATLSLIVGAAINVKFTGLLLLPVTAIAMGIRAMSPEPWLILGRKYVRRSRKLGAAAAVCFLVGLFSYVMIWACYAFRFDAGPDNLPFSMARFRDDLAEHQIRAEGEIPKAEKVAACPTALTTRMILAADEMRLIPRAFAAGLIYTQSTDAGDKVSYLLGERYQGGKWIYFPAALLFKEPLAIIAAALLALCVRIHAGKSLFASDADRWAAVCLGVPAGVYGLVACASDVNMGIRHFFPVLPFLYIAVAMGCARFWRWNPGKVILLTIALELLSETAWGYPDYIAFFNPVFAPHRMHLLSDSNLDWGQDLPLLAAWQRKNPDVSLYLDYFGDEDPSRFGLKFIDVSSGIFPHPHGNAVFAISSTFIQIGGYSHSATQLLGIDFRRRPIEVLGGTIYLFSVAK